MPDIKSALSTALASTPLKPKTQMHRLWLWIKDHPGIGVKRLKTELYINQASVSSLCTQMYMRSMLTRVKVQDQKGEWKTQYSVEPKMRGVYELLPLDKSKRKSRAPVAATLPAAPAPRQSTPIVHYESARPIPPVIAFQEPKGPVLRVPPVAETPQMPIGMVERSVEQYTIKEAREMWEILNKLFGEKK